MKEIAYGVNSHITTAEFIAVLRASTLGARRPVDDVECMEGMLRHASLIVTARTQPDGELIGVARSVTDFHYACYLSDLAVDSRWQQQGVGRHLIRLTRQQLGPRCQLMLLAAPAAADYYPRLGFDHHPQAWILRPGREIV